MNDIVYLNVEDLCDHPDNPRKELGDLTELDKSIRANGILQNLTVVPNYDPGGHRIHMGTYTVIAGHRRLAAAKEVGMETVPCVITELSPVEQIGMMLSENIQRKNLTVWEESQGFQMMLDLGGTVADIAERSGFSKSTVYKRLKLQQLDREKFKAADARGATLDDYMELDKIESPELKNTVLDAIGTPNFKNELKKAIDKEAGDKKLSAYVAAADSFAERVETRPENTVYYGQYGRWNSQDTIVRPEDADSVKYYYTFDGYYLALYKDKVEENQPEETEEQRQRREMREAADRKREALQQISDRHFRLRMDFVSQFGRAKDHKSDIMRFAMYALLYGMETDAKVMVDCLGISDSVDSENDDTLSFWRELCNLAADSGEARYLMCAVYAAIDSCQQDYWTPKWNAETRAYEYIHAPNEDLDRVYDFLTSLGYEMSDEEKAMQDGTHELFTEDAGNE